MTSRTLMELAVIEATKSIVEDDRAHPKVGVVVARQGEVLAVAHRGELKSGEHAEYTALEQKLKDTTIAGATVFTTLEPCTSRNHPKVPCVERLVERKVGKVVIGQLDPNPSIRGNGILRLREANIRVELFPPDLAARLEEMNREFARSVKVPPVAAAKGRNKPGQDVSLDDGRLLLSFRETAYDALGHLYDVWYKDHWCSDEPYLTLLSVVRQFYEGKEANVRSMRVLDCACGTGNTFVAFTKNGYDIYGTEARKNCRVAGIKTDKLVERPITWTDGVAYERKFGTESFDLIVNTANSLCHIPPVPEYMGSALMNFYRLLKPGGFLLVDTKRYVQSDPEDGVKSYRELRYIAELRDWIVRGERLETREMPPYGKVDFHTRLLYDNDPSFGEKVRRALIVLTVHGCQFAPRVHVIPYYPLPSSELADHMGQVGFVTTVFPAMKDITANWRYDIVAGRKPCE